MPVNRLEKDSFFHKVYHVVRQVPKGRVTTYGAVAKYLGTGLSSRMVGWALNGCHKVQPPVPAQRVVNRNGLLTGRHHFPTPTLMEELLMSEGIQIKESCIVNFEKHFWDPSKELGELPI
jgi:methylated-DNA-protein-cysteine methyltransferase related protein